MDTGESQFFDHELVAVIGEFRRGGTHIVAAALDLDFRGEPFGVVPTLVEEADVVHRLFGRETAVDVLTREARELLAGAEDISVLLLRGPDRTAGGRRVVLRMTACLIWSPTGSWLDNEREFDVTIELAAGRGGGWHAVLVRIDPPTPEGGPVPVDLPVDVVDELAGVDEHGEGRR